MSYAAFFTIVLLVTACSPSTQQIMQSWEGHHRDDLIRAWGPPTQEVPLRSGATILFYREGGRQVFVPLGGMVVSRQLVCETRFETDSTGVIRQWRFQGNC